MVINERNVKIVETIEVAFTDYISGRSNISRLQLSLSKLLSSLEVDNNSRTNHIDVWVTGKHRQPTFFMCITPIDTMITEFSALMSTPNCTLADAISKWNMIDKWVLEIEEEILNPREINFTATELTAILLHEFGHVIYSNSVPEKIYNSFQASRLRYMRTKDLRKVKLFANFLAIPINVACHVTSNMVKKGSKVEFEADKYVMLYGSKYGKALASALDKIIYTYGTSSIKDETYNARLLDNEMDWTMQSIKEAVSRSGKIKNELAYRAARSERKTLKTLCIKIMNAFGISFKDKYSNSTTEMAVESFNEVFQDGVVLPYTHSLEYTVGSNFGKLMNAVSAIDNESDVKAIEAFIFNKKKSKDPKSLLPSQYEIDNIAIEIDRIKNHQDRIFVLDLIYNKLEDLHVFQDAMEHDGNLKRKYETDVQYLIEQLNSMRTQVLKKSNLDRKYKLWVQVPAGYEG